MESKVLQVALELVVPVELVEQAVMLLIHLADVADVEVQVELEVKLLSHSAVAEEDLEVVLVPVVIPVETVVDHWKATVEVVLELRWHSVFVLVASIDPVCTSRQSLKVVGSLPCPNCSQEHL